MLIYHVAIHKKTTKLECSQKNNCVHGLQKHCKNIQAK